MSRTDLLALLPLLIVAGTAFVTMLLVAVRRSHVVTAALTVAGLGAALAVVPVAGEVSPHQVTALLIVDPFGLFYVALLAAGALATALLSFRYLGRLDEHREEFYVLLLLATLGAMVLAESRHMASLFLGLETLSVSLYAMIAYARASPRSTEAGLKYLILAAGSSAFLLFGMALLYAASGTLELPDLVRALGRSAAGSGFLPVGMTLVLVGLGFKLAAVPFHMWTPDVYQGAPAPVTGFVATVSKGGVVALLLRLLADVAPELGTLWPVIAVVAVASMFVGNLLALRQDSVKRLLAYSSIAHIGYLLVAVLASGSLAAEAATFYLVTYFVSTLAAFGVVTSLSEHDGDWDRLAMYRGLYWKRPWTAAVMSASLFSLAGIPLTAGFVGKYFVVAAAVESSLWAPVILLALNSAISIYYYLRVIVAMYARVEEAEAIPAAAPRVALAGAIALTGLALLLVWLGVLPAPIMDFLHPAAAALF